MATASLPVLCGAVRSASGALPSRSAAEAAAATVLDTGEPAGAAAALAALAAEVDVGAQAPDGRQMVTSNLADGSLSVIDVVTRKVVRTIRVSGSAEAQQVTLLFSPDGSRLYVAETGGNKIAEIDFASGELLGRLSGGAQGDGLAIVP